MKLSCSAFTNDICDFEGCQNPSTEIVALIAKAGTTDTYTIVLSCDEHVEALKALNPSEYWVICPVCGIGFGV